MQGPNDSAVEVSLEKGSSDYIADRASLDELLTDAIAPRQSQQRKTNQSKSVAYPAPGEC